MESSSECKWFFKFNFLVKFLNFIWPSNIKRSQDFQALKEKDLGNAAYKQKKFDEALGHYDKAIELDPTNMTLFSNKAGRFSFRDYYRFYWGRGGNRLEL